MNSRNASSRRGVQLAAGLLAPHVSRQKQSSNSSNCYGSSAGTGTVLLAILSIVIVISNFATVASLQGSSSGSSYSLERPGWRSSRPSNDPFWDLYLNISIVYTWVNGSDPTFRSLRAAHGKKGSESRYRDSEELLHSMRSLARCMPWHTGEVILVTPGHYPFWLNRSHPRIRLVDQNDIIPEEAQPAFNSAVIEQSLWKIPGLTDVFIHMNDDYILGRRTHPSDFITDTGGVRLFHEGNTIKGGTSEYRRLKSLKQKQWLGSVYHTVGLMSDKLSRASRARKFVKHAPFVYSRVAFEEIHRVFEKELLRAAKYRFRSYEDILVPFLHHNYLIEHGKNREGFRFDNHVGSQDLDAVLCIVRDDTRPAYRKMSEHLSNPHMFFTVNDGFTSREAAELIRAFLHKIESKASAFELQEAVPELRSDVALWSDSYWVMRSRCRQAAEKVLDKADSAAHVSPPTAVPVPATKKGLDVDCSCLEGQCTPAGCVCHSEMVAGPRCSYPVAHSQKTYEVVPACEGVDVVFTWVNGSDAKLLVEVAEHGRRREDTKPSRTRDLKQLRYGLRSVQKYLPWVRHIWVVSGTPCPSWLDPSHPKVSYVPHSAIFSPSELPQLNSNSIQARLWAIPGLAYRFISMDDDFLFTRPTPPTAVLGRTGIGTRQIYRGLFSPSKHMAGAYRDSLIKTLRVVEDHFGIEKSEWLTQAHSPPIFDKFVLAEVHKAFANEFARLSRSKFRKSNDLEPNFAYAWFMQGYARGKPLSVLKELIDGNPPPELAGVTPWELSCRIGHPSVPECPPPSLLREPVTPACLAALVAEVSAAATNWEAAHPKEGLFIMLRESTDLYKLRSRLENGRTRTACLNDDYPEDKEVSQAVNGLLKLLDQLFPERAPWEI